MSILDCFHESWHPIVNLLYQKDLKYLSEEILPNISYQPDKKNIFRIFSMPVKDIKVVILGQDPYPTPGNAIGRAFAVEEWVKEPVSLRNIKKEVWGDSDVNISEFFGFDQYNTLEHWENQGIFLLNTALTVETGKAGSHIKYWKVFTKRVISHISSLNPCVWILWGKKAQDYRLHISGDSHYVHGYNKQTISNIPSNEDWNYILQAPHPAAEAYAGGKAGFFGCKHFFFTNVILEKTKSTTIVW